MEGPANDQPTGLALMLVRILPVMDSERRRFIMVIFYFFEGWEGDIGGRGGEEKFAEVFQKFLFLQFINKNPEFFTKTRTTPLVYYGTPQTGAHC